MISGLPSDFIAKTQSKNRKPVQLCHFHFRGKTYLLSDSPVGTVDGLMYDYDPIIESWGTIKDTSNLDQSFSGNSLEIKSTSLSIIITSEYKDLLQDAFTYGLDNSVVELYQWFKDLPNEAPVLMDVMVAQDPIQYSERSAVFQVDLVSVLMRNNPFLWPREPGEETRDIVIGKVSNVPLFNQQTAAVSTIEEDLTFDFTGEIFIGNGVGFRAGIDKMAIDAEIVTYSWISASAMNITARGVDGTIARPHLQSALICHPDAVFDYSICAGPVALVDNFIGNDIPYTQPYILFPGQNPVIARFVGRPPWLRVDPGISGPAITPEPETNTEYGSSVLYTKNEGSPYSVTYMDAINSPSSNHMMTILDKVGSSTVSYNRTTISLHSLYNLSTYPTVSELATSSVNNYTGGFGSATAAEGLQDGVSGYKQLKYSVDESSKGILTDLTIEVSFDDARITNSSGTINIYFIDSNDSAYLIDTQTITATTAQTFKFNNSTYSYNVKAYVTDFLELKDCGVRTEYVNNHNAEGGGGGVTPKNVVWKMYYSSSAATTPKELVESHFDRDLSALGALTSVECKVKFSSVVLAGTLADREIVVNGVNVWDDSISANSDVQEVTVATSITSFSELEAAKVGIRHTITGPTTPGTVRQINTYFYYVKWILTYQPGAIDTPDEERVVYADDLVCDVTSNLGENPTPAKVIRYLLEDHSSNGIYINNNSFNSRHDEYEADSYYFNGVLKGDIRLHDAIRQCLREGMARLLFSQGSIGLLNYSVYENPSIDYTIGEDEILLRSKATKNQPTSTIRNDVTLLYDYNPASTEYESKKQIIDVDSVGKFETQEYREEYPLINSSNIAIKISQYIIDRLAKPVTIVTLDMFMSAYVLEKGDLIQFPMPFAGVNATGHIASVDRTIGQGKSNQMNIFKLSIADLVII